MQREQEDSSLSLLQFAKDKTETEDKIKELIESFSKKYNSFGFVDNVFVETVGRAVYGKLPESYVAYVNIGWQHHRN